MSESASNPSFRYGLMMFNYLCLLLMLLFGWMLWQGIRSAGSHQDQAAVQAAEQLLLRLRPQQLVTQRFDAQTMPGCRLQPQIATLEQRLAAMAGIRADGSVAGNYRLAEQLVVDAADWSQLGAACSELRRALRLLLSGNALAQLNWSNQSLALRREQHIAVDSPWVSLPEYTFKRVNPWRGLPGCIRLGDYYLAQGRNPYCAMMGEREFMPLPYEQQPDSLALLLREVNALRQPASPLYQQLTQDAPNLTALPGSGHKREVGFHLELTLQPEMQRQAQQIVRCYSGDSAACKLAAIDGDIGDDFYEQARVRMTGLAIVDVATGRIQALASADTPCYRQQYDGPGRAKECPPVPQTARYWPDKLLNHAVYIDAMPASTIKPILALGLLQTPGYGYADAELTRELKKSDSVAFLARMFCLDRRCDGQNAERLLQAQQAALALGWNRDCRSDSRYCGFSELLLGREAGQTLDSQLGPVTPLGSRVFYGRLFTDAVQPLSRAALSFRRQDAQDCATQRWRKCRGNAIANQAAEVWGQGNARATVLGVAGLYARLGAAANGQVQQRRPYLLQQIWNAAGEAVELPALHAPAAEPLNIAADVADRVLTAMRQGHKPGGTAYAACKASAVTDCHAIDWLAGKTGTPPFGADTLTLGQLQQRCLEQPTRSYCGAETPYKWYAALFQSDPAKPVFDKAIAVLTERNWYRQGPHAGKIDAPADSGSNVSAEIAIRVAWAIRELAR